jgi:hypothetical protein
MKLSRVQRETLEILVDGGSAIREHGALNVQDKNGHTVFAPRVTMPTIEKLLALGLLHEEYVLDPGEWTGTSTFYPTAQGHLEAALGP